MHQESHRYRGAKGKKLAGNKAEPKNSITAGFEPAPLTGLVHSISFETNGVGHFPKLPVFLQRVTFLAGDQTFFDGIYTTLVTVRPKIGLFSH